MGNWYLPPCDEKDTVLYDYRPNPVPNATVAAAYPFYAALTELPGSSDQPPRSFAVTKEAIMRRMFYMQADELYKCYLQRQWSIRYYCSDATSSVLNEAAHGIGWDPATDNLPILCQFSDETVTFAFDEHDTAHLHEVEPDRGNMLTNPRIPLIKKIRYALSKEEIDRLLTDEPTSCLSGPRVPPTGLPYLQPIIWLLNVERHFQHTRVVRRYDIPWHRKKNRAVFRGLLTGLEYDPTATDEENCYNMIRCRFVYQYARSDLVDAKLTSTFNKMPETFHGVNLTGEELRKKDFLEHKGFVILEGNDVSSGLKWAMVSQSVVLMPPPTYSSWAMEELLEPWVHYIPLHKNLSDVEDKVRWMIEHDAESQRISHRATLWVLDLFYHPDAMEDNRLINQEILRRYRKHFRHVSGSTKGALP
jgi:hypothetical protein